MRVILYGLHLNKCEKGQQKYNTFVCPIVYTYSTRVPCMHTNAKTLFYLSRGKMVLKGYPKAWTHKQFCLYI